MQILRLKLSTLSRRKQKFLKNIFLNDYNEQFKSVYCKFARNIAFFALKNVYKTPSSLWSNFYRPILGLVLFFLGF